MSVFIEYGIKAQIPEAHDLLFTDNLELQGNTIGGNGTPETPIAIQSVESPISIVNCGKNLFDINGDINDRYDGVISNGNSITESGELKTIINTTTTRSAGQVLTVIPNQIYTISYNVTYLPNECRIILYYLNDANIVFTKRIFAIGNGSFSFTPILDKVIVTFGFHKTGGDYALFKDIQVEIGATATTYEPYQGSTLSIPIKDTNGNNIPLRRVGTAYDSVYKENGKWYLRKAINEQALNGSEVWQNTADRFYTSKPDAKMPVNEGTLANLIATTHPTVTLNQVLGGGNGVYFAYNNLGLRDTVTFAGFTVADLKTWISTHNITVAYELATPETIELHEDTATALDNLTSQNIINIFSTDDIQAVLDLSGGLTVSYGTSKRANFKIPSIHNSKTVTRIKERGFSGKKQLTYIYIPESIKVLEDSALNQNANIIDVYINRSVNLGITTSGINMFTSCPKLTNIYVPDAESVIAYKAAPNWSQYADKIKLQ